jgi:hypothetical protein
MAAVPARLAAVPVPHVMLQNRQQVTPQAGSDCHTTMLLVLQVAVSFAHIVKSAEPVFSVLLSGPILGTTYPW